MIAVIEISDRQKNDIHFLQIKIRLRRSENDNYRRNAKIYF
jgi:hypothetical protein